jgi:hypothetical protein
MHTVKVYIIPALAALLLCLAAVPATAGNKCAPLAVPLAPGEKIVRKAPPSGQEAPRPPADQAGKPEPGAGPASDAAPKQ